MSTESRCCKKVKCSVTTGWQRPARHRRESGATCSRVTILAGGRDLVDMGNNARSPAPGQQDRPRESVFRSISRMHARTLITAIVAFRAQHNGLVYFRAAALPSSEQCGPESATCMRQTGRFSILLFVESPRALDIPVGHCDRYFWPHRTLRETCISWNSILRCVRVNAFGGYVARMNDSRRIIEYENRCFDYICIYYFRGGFTCLWRTFACKFCYFNVDKVLRGRLIFDDLIWK